MKLVDAQKKDIQQVLNLHNSLFEMPYSYDNYAYEIDLDLSYFKLLKNDDIIIGYFIIHHLFEQLEIIMLAIDKEYQNQGLGTFLMSVIDYYKLKLNCNEILLEVENNNIQAINFYKKHGFEIINTRVNYYGEGKDAHILRK